MRSREDVFTNGTSAIKYIDTRNTHPYGELEITEDSTGKVTGVQFKLDNDTGTRSTNGSLVDLSVIGQVFGSSIGRILAPGNQFGQLLGSTVGGLIGQKLAQNFLASLSFDASKTTNADFATFSGLNVASAVAGSVASFLIAEIGTKLGLQGYGAQLFNNGASAFTGSILDTVIQKGGLHVLAQEATWATAFATAEGAVGGVVGGILAQNLVHAESKQGAVGGQLLGAVGSALGISFVALQALTGLLNFVIPGVGSFFGTILGTMLGDAIAGDPGAPKAFHDVQILGSDDHFTNRLVGTDDHGNAEVSRKMGAEVVTIANNFLDAIDGASIFYPGKLMIGYSDGNGPYDYITGWFPNGTEVAPRFTDPNDAIQQGVRELLMQTLVIGGNLLAKRAQQAFVAGAHPDPYDNPTDFSDLIHLSGDLRTAQDYEIYLNNREAINAVMAANPDTAFTAGWIATFARVNDLKLNQAGVSDFLGGLVGFLDSVSKAGLGAVAANAAVKLSGSNVTVDVNIPNGSDVPGSLSVFADQVSQHSDATGTTVKFNFDSGLGVGGYHGPASAAEVPRDGETWLQLRGGAGNNLWFGRDDLRNEYHDDNAGQSHDILIGGTASDIIYAGNGFDFVDGGAGPGNDQLFGEAGSDILIGGKGADYLEGGEGNDTYVFNRGDGADDVVDTWSPLVFVPNPNGISGSGTYEPRHSDAGSDTLLFGAGISVSDISVQGNGNDVIVAVNDPAHPNTPFAQLTDRITLKNWTDSLDRIEKLSFADGTTYSLTNAAALAGWRVPFGATLSKSSVAENAANGSVVGKVTGLDFDSDPGLRYSLASSAGGRFAIDASTGEVTVASRPLLDYESWHSNDITVTIADAAGNSINRTFTIATIDVFEAPSGVTLSKNNVDENALNGSEVAIAAGIDSDPNAMLTVKHLQRVVF